jgi:hypothetical protein
MKVIKTTESAQDRLHLADLIKQRDKYQIVVNILNDKIRELVYKYDNAKIDYTKNS